ncbi:Ribosome biogenesis protein bms1 [Leucoagaricus sp. SymC.cos]|nr:Ribosome biogenesis protein bms1 [Leucoagaricus sp. SymC.cos]
MEDRQHKAHRPSTSGAKAQKKDKAKGKEKQQGFNAKAFAPKSGRRADRQGRRTAEKNQTRLHVPLVNRTPDENPPPVIVAIVGPPGVGKTTLLKSLVRRYTKQTLTDPKGPITVVSGKKRRLTFIECNNDVNSMIDIGKVADLVLLMIDGSFGFEMETFEFLNILQSHGFPKVIGILSHLDLIKKAVTLKATKKALKKRFWTEIYQGAKLFYLSGVINGRYPDTEILNLSRFISVMKFRPLVFRNSHPYVLVDRLEDLTPRELVRTSKGKCDRTVTVYGYVRGTNLRLGAKVHIPGVGDLDVTTVQHLGDPCPLPDEESEKRRKLSEKKKLLIHAPMSDVGGVIYDKDAVWINVPGSFSRGNNEVSQGEGEQMVMDLQDVANTLEDAVSKSQIRLFGTSSNPLTITPDEDAEMEDEDEDVDEDEDEEEDEEGSEDEEEFDSDAEDDSAVDLDHLPPGASNTDLGDNDDEPNRRVRFTGDDDDVDIPGGDDDGAMDGDGEDEGEEVPRWKAKLSEKAQSLASSSRKGKRKDWIKLIYSSNLTPEEILYGKKDANEEEGVDDFFTIKHKSDVNEAEVLDMSKESYEEGELEKWEDEELLESIRGLFITGEDSAAAGENGEDEWNDVEGEGGVESGSEGEGDNNDTPGDQATKDAKTLQAKKEVLKRKFDEQYDDPESSKADFYDTAKDEIARQLALNKAEFEGVDSESRTLVEGFRPGIYVQVRIKRHRWFTRPLKTNDPLILSLGWRRFQTVPIYSLDDHSIRMHMLKYTPEHTHCYATFYGPVSLPNTGFCAFNSLGGDTPGFRISATGVVLDIDRSVKIVKKLKLTRMPYKNFKNTAFIKDVFNSAGQVKKALPKPDGAFWATFEDKVLKSDLIFLWAWYSIEPQKFYNPVTSLLLPNKTSWMGMRLTGQIQRDEGLKTPLNVNSTSTYKKIERPARKFNPLHVPQKLQASLPYASKPKLMTKQQSQTYLQKRAVVMEPEEREAVALLQQMRAQAGSLRLSWAGDTGFNMEITTAGMCDSRMSSSSMLAPSEPKSPTPAGPSVGQHAHRRNATQAALTPHALRVASQAPIPTPGGTLTLASYHIPTGAELGLIFTLSHPPCPASAIPLGKDIPTVDNS